MKRQNENAEKLTQLAADKRLTKKDRHAAWELFHKKGYEAAEQLITEALNARPQDDSMALRDEPLTYPVWGRDFIEENTLTQMNYAMRLPIAGAGALMPDAHLGYGLPIGGVLGTENVVIPYAVGVDIACRMMISIFPESPEVLDKPGGKDYKRLRDALEERTIFGAGGGGMHDGLYEHEVLNHDRWQGTPLLRELRKTAIHQIGTSGTGNHFVEWGSVAIQKADNPLGLEPGDYLALLSHSGSRGVGYKIADYYSKLAMALMPGLDAQVRHLAWLSLEGEEGQEYWEAMHLAGDFASANHHIIHEQVARAAKVEAVAQIENHHNFAWKEGVEVDGQLRELVVHRKGATPAGKGVLGIIPGTMADPGYIVMGKGVAESLNSASHGGGRQMSRRQAKDTINQRAHAAYLKDKGVTLIGGGLDEAPQAYKNIQDVIDAQSDLVEIVGVFQPRLVRMATDSDGKFGKRKPVPKGVVDAEGD